MLWSPESPSLYKAVSKVYADNRLVDEYTTRFGIRSLEFVADKGFFAERQAPQISRSMQSSRFRVRWERLSMYLPCAIS